jgi:Flp pilus assembly protein TadG
VESALVLLLFVSIVLGVIEIGRMVFAYNFVSWAASTGSRYASVRGERSGHPVSSSDVKNYVTNRTIALDKSALAVNTSWTPNAQPGSVVKVTVSYNFKPILTFLPIGPSTFRSSSEMTITQ